MILHLTRIICGNCHKSNERRQASCLVYYTTKTYDLAINNKEQIFKVVAVLKRGKHIVKIGVNSDKTNPRFPQKYTDGTVGYCMHAEMNVLRWAKPGDKLEVLRFRNDDKTKLAMAKPCIHCQKYIKLAGIKKVKYTNNHGDWENLKIN